VSYLNFEGKDDYDADIKLHNRLSGMAHWSPFEHCAQAMCERDFEPFDHMEGAVDWINDLFGWSGNFKGFVQYRKTFAGENKSDNRLIKK